MATKSVLPELWEVPQIFRDRLGEQAGRQRAMFADGHLLLVMHAPPQADEDTRAGRYFWRQPDGSWHSSEGGSGPNAVQRHIGEYADAVEYYDQREDEAQSADEYFELIEGLAPLHRASRNMHAVLQEARKLVPHDRDIINLRDGAYEVERTAELLYDVSKNSLDFAVAKRSEEQAKASHEMAVAAHRLNLFVAFFFPVATLAAIFGMSVDSPLTNWLALPWLLIMILGLLSGSVLTWFVGHTHRQRQRKAAQEHLGRQATREYPPQRRPD